MDKNMELSPLAKAVEKNIRKYRMIVPEDRVIVGLSGGPDSVCLLSILAELRQVLGIRSLHAVHVNHGLRGEESDQDQRYAEEIASELSASFNAVQGDVRKMAEELRLGEEAAGRKLRYDSFEHFRQQYRAQRIAVAHNRNDQAETVMMRLIRGTGLRGLSGIDQIRKDGIVIRPLLGFSREEIEQYCRQKGFTPRVDSSNLKPVYTRNRIRLDLIPFIEKEYNPRLQDALVRLAEQAAEAEDYLRRMAVQYLDGKAGGSGPVRWNRSELFLETEDFAELHPALAGRVVMEIMERAGIVEDLTSDMIQRVIRTARSRTEPAEADLHDLFYVRKIYGKLWILRRNAESTWKIGVPLPLPVERLEATGNAEVQAGAIRIRLSVSERMMDDVPEDFKKMDSSIDPENEIEIEGSRVRSRKNISPKSDKQVSAEHNEVRAVLDLDNILAEGVPAFRNRRPGDRFRPIGMKGRKKIQDYFTDRKIPRQDRDKAILLALGQNVYFVEGEVSGNCAVTESTRRVLTIEYSRTNAVNHNNNLINNGQCDTM